MVMRFPEPPPTQKQWYADGEPLVSGRVALAASGLLLATIAFGLATGFGKDTPEEQPEPTTIETPAEYRSGLELEG